MSKHPHGDHDISGAGVLLIEKNEGKYYFVLFHDLYKKLYSDAGGNREKDSSGVKESCESCARRELFEESQMLYHLLIIQKSPREMLVTETVDESNGTKYKCYILLAPHIDESLYVENFKTIKRNKIHIDTHNCPYDIQKNAGYFETDAIAKIPIDNISLFAGQHTALDKNGTTISIMGRTCKIIRENIIGIKEMLKKGEPPGRTYIVSTDCNISFGTVTFTIQVSVTT